MMKFSKKVRLLSGSIARDDNIGEMIICLQKFVQKIALKSATQGYHLNHKEVEDNFPE